MKNKFNIGDRVVSDSGVTFKVNYIYEASPYIIYSGGLDNNGHFREENLKLALKTEIYYHYVYISRGCVRPFVSTKLYKNDTDFQTDYDNSVIWFHKLPTPFEVPCD